MSKIQLRYTLPLILLILVACKDDSQARWQLEQARQLYENAQYGSAKQSLDELKAQHPKDFVVQKEALHLMREIEWKEQERNLYFCDSLLIVRQAEADSAKRFFIFEKSEYDSEGRYVDKSWHPAVETGGDFIKTGVTEANDMVLTSVHKGTFASKSNQLKVAIPTGEYAGTQALPADGGANYSFPDGNGTVYEILTFQKGRDNGVITFICTYPGEKISLQYLGGKKIPDRILSGKEKESLVRTAGFAAIVKDIERLKKEKEKAQQRIAYLQSKL